MFKGHYKTLKIWERGMQLCKEIYKITKNFPKEELYTLISQMRRCSISIPSNMAEGSRRISDKEFSNFILIARGSLAELETQIILAKEFNYIDENEVEKLLNAIDELDKMIFAFYKRLQAPSS